MYLANVKEEYYIRQYGYKNQQNDKVEK